MTDSRIYPLTFEPQLRQYLWGGRNLERLYGRRLPPGPVAESWEISAHPELPTRALQGAWQGHTLIKAVSELGAALVGTRAMRLPCDARFPLLVKLLDAAQNLSVQVHPDDAYACEHEDGDSGKTECWYILHAEPGVELIYGLSREASPEQLRRAIAEGMISEWLARLPVQAGDCVFVPAGTVHAITAGAVLVEIQQNSNATYRVYDWERVDANGRPRELHIERALDVIAWHGDAPGIAPPEVLWERDGARLARLVTCRHFYVEQLDLAASGQYRGMCGGETFEIWGCIQGQVELKWEGPPLSLEAVQFALLPAALGAFELRASSPSRLLRAYLGGEDHGR